MSAPPLSGAADPSSRPDSLEIELDQLAAQLSAHPVWSGLRSLEDVRRFMEHHVWAVWDFMSLLKSLQRDLAPVRVPWLPQADPESARLINQIVVSEEADDGPDGRIASHFEIYLDAMTEAGASTRSIRTFTASLAADRDPEAALALAAPPPAAEEFALTTLVLCRASLPERVAAFTLGREQIIPGMFAAMLRDLPDRSQLGRFIWYLERHVSIDGERHGPLADRLYRKTCFTDPVTRLLSLRAAERALERRLALWDAIVAPS